MYVKKAGGKIFGAELTAAEQKAMNIEIQRQLGVMNEENLKEIDAMILWVLHSNFGFGETRLRRFYDCFAPEIRALTKRYELDESDNAWVCQKKLLDAGIDISEW